MEEGEKPESLGEEVATVSEVLPSTLNLTEHQQIQTLRLTPYNRNPKL